MDRALDQLRRHSQTSRMLTLSELVGEYLRQHQAEPETIEKLRWLLAKSVSQFGQLHPRELEARDIAAWRMTLPAGHRFEATQALRQVLARAQVWGLIDSNVAKVGVDNPVPTRREQHPFESWDELLTVAGVLGPRYGPMVMFAAASGLRPGEWIALEHRDIDLHGGVVHVRRAFRNDRLKGPKTRASTRAVPLQRVAIDALSALHARVRSDGTLVFPAPRGGYLQLHNFRPREWRPAQQQVGIAPARRVYDLRHTFATFALRAGVSTFDLSRYMGASLTMIDRHYGHLARDSRDHTIALLDTHAQYRVDAGGHPVDTDTSAAAASH